MSTIIYDARRIKAFEQMQALKEITGKSQEEIDALWGALLSNGKLMAEFVYYLDHQTFLDELKCEGYGLTDLYMWLLRQYNIRQDYGKNDERCDKETLAIDTFLTMVKMIENPAPYVAELENDFGMGMDQR